MADAPDYTPEALRLTEGPNATTHPLMDLCGVTGPDPPCVVMSVKKSENGVLSIEWMLDGWYPLSEANRLADHHRALGKRMLVQRLNLHLSRVNT